MSSLTLVVILAFFGLVALLVLSPIARGWISAAWARILAWCSDSETIVLARLEMAAGFFATVMAPFDWTSVLSPAMDWRQGLLIGIAFFVKGALGEMARRHRATDL